MIVPAAHPIGQLSQMPAAPRNEENMKASPARSIRSENVDTMKGTMSPAPQSIESVMILNVTTI